MGLGGACVLKMSDDNFEQRCAIRFCFRLGHSATDTFAKLQHVYEDNVFSRAQRSVKKVQELPI
ncbi:hypothetical protein NQ318_000476 [Aromia moschata]|uniref:Mos1 transposase HTH domain-containing protein n=1 Tax=Aromia moschata TaxID=1265417 RepID=A0AAV8YVT8_9CUCU|nr:hypothetical protein NQ318_000476 [Aromia moschata]